MGELVMAAAMSHAPGIAAFTDKATEEERNAFLGGAAELRKVLAAAKPDVMIYLAPDHFTNFFVDKMPAFCIGVNEGYEGPVEKWLGIPKGPVPGAPDLPSAPGCPDFSSADAVEKTDFVATFKIQADAATKLKAMLGYDDALDAFGVHCVGGIIGALGTGIFVNPALGGTGVYDYVANAVAPYDFSAQMIAQLWGVGTALVWSGVSAAVILLVLKYTIGVRSSDEAQEEGLDIADHGEKAYNQ